MLSAILYILAAASLCGAAVFALLAEVDVFYMSGSKPIKNDGLRRGTVTAPTWTLISPTGKIVHSPPKEASLQLIVFGDHSLKSFPSVVEGLKNLTLLDPLLDIVVLTRHPNPSAVQVLRTLGLGGLPVVTGSSALYGKYNVRVVPFVIFVDSDGQARGSSLVNHAWQLEKLWRLARVPPDPSEISPPRRSRRHPVRARV